MENVNIDLIVEGMNVEEIVKELNSEGIIQEDILVAYENHGGEDGCRKWITDNFDKLVDRWAEEDEVDKRWGESDESVFETEGVDILVSMMKYTTIYYIKWILQRVEA